MKENKKILEMWMRHELDTEKSPDHGKIDLIAAECTKRGV